MTVHRFHVEQIPPLPSAILDGPEAHHAIKVLRIKAGEEIELFDGNGTVARGKIESLGKRELNVALNEPVLSPLDHDHRLHFAVALPKGDRQRSVIEKLVELGVDSLTPLNTRYSVAEVDDGNRDRCVRYALEACKQSERNRNIEVRASASIEQITETIRQCVAEGGNAYILHPAERLTTIPPVNVTLESPTVSPTSALQVLFLIGPEGGFSEQEVLLCLEHGAQLLSLGKRILRVETAVSVAATLGQIKLGSLQPL